MKRSSFPFVALLLIASLACNLLPGVERNTSVEPTAPPPDQADLTLSLGAPTGETIRPLLGVNIGPIPAGDNPANADLTEAYHQIGVTMIRTHDYYGPLDMAVMYPDQNADPSDPASYDFSASDEVFRAILAGGFEPYLRLGDSWNVRGLERRAPVNPGNWVRAAVEVVRRYDGMSRQAGVPLRYVEIWNEPNLKQFWDGTQAEFFDLFAATVTAVKAEFPDLKVGGPGLTPAGALSPQGQKYVRDFLANMQLHITPLDFLSWHVYANDPEDFVQAAIFYRQQLDAYGYTEAESHITEWNTAVKESRADDAPDLRYTAQGAAILSAAWIGLQEQGVDVSTFYRGPDPDINAPHFYGMFYADGRPKPIALAFSLWAELTRYPQRAALTASADSGLWTLAAQNGNGETAILIANPDEQGLTYRIVLPDGSAARAATVKMVSEASEGMQEFQAGDVIEIPGYSTQLVILANVPPLQASASLTTAPFDPAKLGTVERDLTYCTVDGVALKMDVYYPQTDSGPWPAVMYVHGGGWVGGDKGGGAGSKDIPALREAGYLVVAVNYRLAPEYKFPAMIEDVKCAVRSLRAHAVEYNLDPERIGVWGGSAGGHLVSLLGLSDESAGWDVGEYLDQSSRVQAVVDMFGPSDLTHLGDGDRARRRSAQVFGADGTDDPILAAASPVTHVTPDDPPFLILHGWEDDVVRPSQSQTLYDRLSQAGVPATLVMVENAGHSFKPVDGKISPSREEITQMVVDFFDQYLR
ncbi:MAG: alpha/beta hydrolase fold domain-containing protein [Chloroflexi bacterium]|nr:alpha/beta hydrolase fold domain-containing protein [Chloroflexota bacterium]